MGMFDSIGIERMIVMEGCPPILPLSSYQTKSLDNLMKNYSLEEATKKFRPHYDEGTFRLYSLFDEGLLEELLREEEINTACLFWLDRFSAAASAEWLEYALTIEEGEVKWIELVGKRGR